MGKELVRLSYYDGEKDDFRTVECDLSALCESSKSYDGSNQYQYAVQTIKKTNFELIDIPDVMRSELGWNLAAKLQELWFKTPSRKMTGSHKEGRVPWDGNVLTDFYTVDWARKQNESVQVAYDELAHNKYAKLRTPACLTQLRRFLPGGDKYQFLKEGKNNTFDEVQNNMQNFHRQYQVQLAKIGQDYSQLFLQAVWRDMDEFYAVSGPCSLYAAIGEYESTPKFLKITSIFIYIRDTFDFNAGSGKDKDQYLGHWNRKGFRIIKAYALHERMEIYIEQSLGDKLTSFNDHATLESSNKIFYCVRNSTYEKWREKNKKGGDVLVFSSMKEIKLENPIIMNRV